MDGEKISSRLLILTAFVSGMAVMAFEMAASRLMAPYFGTSVFVWTNLLGIIMLALSLGYWYGGRLVDRFPTPMFLYSLLLFASLVLLLLPFTAPLIMSFVGKGVQEGEISLVVNSFLSSLIVFCFPFLLLGMVSPTIIRLLSQTVEKTGEVAGKVYAASTVGSILGTFLPTLVFVPWIGTKKTMLVFAVLLLGISIVGLGKKFLWSLIGLACLAFLFINTGYSTSDRLIFETETSYLYIQIEEDPVYGRILKQDEGYSIHSYYHPDKLLIGSYWDYLLVAPYFQPTKVHQRLGVIGAAGGTSFRIWQDLLGDEFDFDLTGAEIDPEVVRLSKEYFGMDQYQNVHVAAQDGRVFLQQNSDPFDVIFLDAYHQIYMPPHLTSLEFFELAEEQMCQDGVLVANVNSLFEESEILLRFERTLQEVFDHVWVVKVSDANYNYMFYATNGSLRLEEAIEFIPERYSEIKFALRQKAEYLDDIDYDVALVTDDRPLSEVLFDKMIGQWIWGGV